jgi:predicted SpoU family rRNA methylase
MKHYTDFRRSDFTIVGELKVEKLLEILGSSNNYVGVATAEPHSNVAKLEILAETLKVLKSAGRISDDGAETFFTPLKTGLVLKKRRETSNYFSHAQTTLS